jgi:hypothetical protein
MEVFFIALCIDSSPRDQSRYGLFGLLAVTSVRIGEALGLQRQDVDPQQGWPTARGAKFAKSRSIAFRHSTRDVLPHYAKRRDAELNRPVAAKPLNVRKHCTPRPFARSATGSLYAPDCGNQWIAQEIACTIFGTAFATETLPRCYRPGRRSSDTFQCCPRFSGHSRTRDTYWYSTTCAELMGEASPRLEQDSWGQLGAHAELHSATRRILHPARFTAQRQVSPHAVALYHSTASLSLCKSCGPNPRQSLVLAHIDAASISAFLDDLEQEAASSFAGEICSLPRFDRSSGIPPIKSWRVQRRFSRLSIPSKRHDHRFVGFVLGRRSTHARDAQPSNVGWAPRSRFAHDGGSNAVLGDDPDRDGAISS